MPTETKARVLPSEQYANAKPIDTAAWQESAPTIARRSTGDNLFARVRTGGGVTAAAAYHWVSELYVRTPFDPARDRMLTGNGDINHGAFYWRDDYPDDHLFADAESLLRHGPHFLLLHPMNVDDVGHKAGGNSAPYRNAARHQGDLLARYVPEWQARGYTVLVTADHGMGDDGNHSGPTETESHVPFYALGLTLDPAPTQIRIAGLCCRLIGVETGAMPNYDGTMMRRLYALPLVLFLALIVGLPLASVIAGSFAEGDPFAHYKQILTSRFYTRSFTTTLNLSLLTTLIGLGVALALAVILRSRAPRLSRIALVLGNLGANFSGVPSVLAFVILLGANGVMTRFLIDAGIIGSFDIYSFSGLAITYSFFPDRAWRRACPARHRGPAAGGGGGRPPDGHPPLAVLVAHRFADGPPPDPCCRDASVRQRHGHLCHRLHPYGNQRPHRHRTHRGTGGR